MATTLISTDNRRAVMSSAGYTFDTPVTAADAITQAGLDWQVEKVAVQGGTDAGVPLVHLDRKGDVRPMDFGNTVRKDTGQVLGSISMKGYNVFQNDVLADLGGTVLDQGGNQIISAGSWKGNARVWLQFQIGQTIDLGGLDPIRTTLMLTSGHDANASLAAMFTVERIFCTNQMPMIVKGAPRIYKLRHAATLDGRIQDIRAALGIGFTYQDTFSKAAERLLKAPMTDRQFGSFMDRLVPLKAGVELDSQAAKNRDEAVDAVRAIFAHSDNLDNVRNTRWGAFQAVVESEDWGRKIRDTQRDSAATARFVRQQSDNPVKQRAFDMLLAMK